MFDQVRRAEGPAVHHAVGGLQVAVALQLRVVDEAEALHDVAGGGGVAAGPPQPAPTPAPPAPPPVPVSPPPPVPVPAAAPDEGVLEVPVEGHLLLLEDVLQGAAGAVLCDQEHLRTISKIVLSFHNI